MGEKQERMNLTQMQRIKHAETVDAIYAKTVAPLCAIMEDFDANATTEQHKEAWKKEFRMLETLDGVDAEKTTKAFVYILRYIAGTARIALEQYKKENNAINS